MPERAVVVAIDTSFRFGLPVRKPQKRQIDPTYMYTTRERMKGSAYTTEEVTEHYFIFIYSTRSTQHPAFPASCSPGPRDGCFDGSSLSRLYPESGHNLVKEAKITAREPIIITTAVAERSGGYAKIQRSEEGARLGTAWQVGSTIGAG